MTEHLSTSFRDEGESEQTIVVTFTVVYKTDAPLDYDPDRALDALLDHAPQAFVLTGADELMDDAYDMEAVGWEITTARWGDIGTGVRPGPLLPQGEPE